MPITTRLSQLLKVRVPVVCAPMAGAAGGALAASVTRGGGFGFIAGGHTPLASLLKEIDIGRKALGLSAGEKLPFGIGLLLWRLEAPHGDPSLAPAFLDAIVDAKPAAVWFSFGANLRYWVDRWRALEQSRGVDRTVVFVMVGSVKQALEVKEWDVDIVVAQGTESGGHGPTHDVGLPLISLLPLLAPHFSPTSLPLLIPAGGLVNGSHLASILPFSPGMVLGTAFLPTPEALYTTAQKELIVASSGEQTLRSGRWDEARGTLGWGPGVDGRGLGNKTSAEEGGGGTERYDQAVKEGDVERIVTWAGSSVGLIKQIRPAEEIVKEIEQEAEVCLDSLIAMRA